MYEIENLVSAKFILSGILNETIMTNVRHIA